MPSTPPREAGVNTHCFARGCTCCFCPVSRIFPRLGSHRDARCHMTASSRPSPNTPKTASAARPPLPSCPPYLTKGALQERSQNLYRVDSAYTDKDLLFFVCRTRFSTCATSNPGDKRFSQTSKARGSKHPIPCSTKSASTPRNYIALGQRTVIVWNHQSVGI